MLPSSQIEDVSAARKFAREQEGMETRKVHAIELIADELEAIRFILQSMRSEIRNK